MKIYIICDDADVVGGVSKFVTHMEKLLRSNNVPVEVISRYRDSDSKTNFTYLYPRSYRADLQLQAKGDSAAEVRVKEAKTLAHAKMSRIMKTMTERDVLFAVQIGALVEAFNCGYWQQCKPYTVFQYHGAYEYARKQSYFKLLTRALKHVDCSIFLTSEDKSAFAKNGASNPTTVANGIELATQPPTPLSDRPNIAVFMGRLHPEKSPLELIEAWNKLGSKSDGWELHIYGDGILRSAVCEAASEAPLNNIAVRGRTNAPIQVFSNSKLHLMASHEEGMPMSILEASSVGVPTIAYNAGAGTRELIAQGQTGWYSQVGNVAKLSNNISHYLDLNNASLNEVANANLENVKKYDQTEIDKRWINLFTTRQRRTAQPEAVENLTVETGSLCFEHDLSDTESVNKVVVVTRHKELPNKAFVLVARVFDENGTDVSAEAISWPWSGLLHGNYCNLPAVDEGVGFAELELSITGSATKLILEIHPWGLKRHKADNEIASAWLVCDRVEGGLNVQTSRRFLLRD